MTEPRQQLPFPAPSELLAEGTAEPTPVQRYVCDSCGKSFTGLPGGAGLLIWTRGDETRYEEPPLCDECASKISVGALIKWAIEDEEEG